MKILINPDYLTPLKTARDRIKNALAEYEAADTSLPKMEADEEALNASVARIEAGTEYGDEKGIAVLTTKREQLACVRRKIEKAKEQLEPLWIKLQEALHSVQETVHRAVDPELKKLQTEIAQQLLPICGTRDQVVRFYPQMMKHRSFVHYFYDRRFGTMPDSAAEARIALPILNALIAGENPWVFEVESGKTLL